MTELLPLPWEGSSRHNTSRCQDTISSCWCLCFLFHPLFLIRVLWDVFCNFPPTCIASQAGGKSPGIQWLRSRERGWFPTHINLSTFISNRNPPRVGTTVLKSTNTVFNRNLIEKEWIIPHTCLTRLSLLWFLTEMYLVTKNHSGKNLTTHSEI